MKSSSIVKKITKKVGSAVPYRLLFDIINIINNYMYEEIINDRLISIDGLGYITQIVPKSTKRWSRFQNKYVMSKPTKKLVFRANKTFKKLIELKRESLKIPAKNKAKI
jgi:hypothetical protein